MSKTNVEEQTRKIKEQVANTSGGNHLGGTHFGQEKDASKIPDPRRDSTENEDNSKDE